MRDFLRNGIKQIGPLVLAIAALSTIFILFSALSSAAYSNPLSPSWIRNSLNVALLLGLGLIEAIPSFFGTIYGPGVGCFTGSFGTCFALLLTAVLFQNFWLLPLAIVICVPLLPPALAGLGAGLVAHKPQRSPAGPQPAYASISLSILGALGGNLLSVILLGIFVLLLARLQGLPIVLYIAVLILLSTMPGLFLLPILLLCYNSSIYLLRKIRGKDTGHNTTSVSPIDSSPVLSVHKDRFLSLSERTARIIILVFLAVVVIGSLIVIGIQSYKAQQDSDMQIQARERLAMANSSAIARNSYPPNFPGHGMFAFDYSDLSTMHWYHIASEDGSCWASGDGYHMSALKGTLLCDSNHSFENFAFRVQATILRGDCAGILFRFDRKSGKSYVFGLCQDGTYVLFKYLDYQSQPVQLIPITKANDVIKTGLGRTNTIAVVAQGSSITLFINDQRITSIEDKSFTKGSLGLIAAIKKQHNAPTEVIYTDATAWIL
jgi:hypothetical protein